MRSAGCAINDFADRDFDRHVARTKHRVLTSGKVSSKEALIIALACVLIAFLLELWLNALTIQLSLVAVLVAAIYPFSKRFFAIPQLILGVAFSFGIPMAFSAVLAKVPPLAWMIFAANLCWVIAYDTAYAMADKEDDLKLGLKTSAIAFGQQDVMMVIALLGVFILLMAAVLLWIAAGPLAWLGLVVAAVLCTLQVPWVAGRHPTQCLRAFLFNNWVGMAIFAGLVADAAVTN